jgi:hypothetical protein
MEKAKVKAREEEIDQLAETNQLDPTIFQPPTMPPQSQTGGAQPWKDNRESLSRILSESAQHEWGRTSGFSLVCLRKQKK